MAGRDVERKVRIYRSVSFKKLGNWNAKAFSEEGGTELAGKGDVTQPTCQKTHRPPARSLSLTRKVSKISSASKDKNISSVRQLSQRFSPHQSDDGAVSDDENLRRVDHRFQAGTWEGTSAVEPSHTSQLKQDFINPTGSDGLSLALPGKLHDFHSPSPRESPSSGISLDEVNTFCSFLHQPDNRELLVTEGTNWPSVTEMRKLFGESSRKAPSRASSLPDCDEPRISGQPGSHVRETSGMEPQGHCPIETTTAKSFNHYAKDQPSGTAHWPKNPSSKVESNYCRALTESKTEQHTACLDTKEHRIINTGPKPQPPPPPPRSCIPFGLKAHTLSSGLPKQEARQQSVSLHSWHSSGKPQTAPNNVRLEDSYSMDEPQKNTLLPTLANKNSSKIRFQEASSGSDEEDELHVLRESLRKRSVRKGKDILVGDDEDFDGDRHNVLVNEASDLGQGSGLSVQKHDAHSILLPSDLVPTVRPDACSVSTATPHETPKQHFRNASEAVSSQNPSQLASVSPMPTVSRVAKVNIPPFLPSPCGSRSSSRYSSSETLKDDDHLNAYYAGQARSPQGGFNVHRSPSFGQHESISRPLVRPRSKIPSSVAKLRNESVNDRQHCDLERDDSKQKKSISNPDITSDTLSSLNYLKSDFLDLKLKSRGQGTSDKEGVCSRLEACQESSGQESLVGRGRPAVQDRLQHGSRPTLKDLTATLRRTKSFTYSDKLGSRRVATHSSMKQSSSELMLASPSDSDGIFSHMEAPNVEKIFNEPEAMQDQYIQEARQVFEKIKQIGSQEDYNFDQEVIEHLKGEKRPNVSDVSVEGVCDGQFLEKCAPNEIVSNLKSSDLSGNESNLTDEGIVTEVDPAPCTSYRDLGQKLKVWKSTGTSQEESEFLHAHNGDYNTVQCHTGNSESTPCSDVSHMTNTQGPMDAPPTPGTVRRRRKFPSLGNSGTDSSSGSNGESGSETYRSLSDPMPHRRYSITEDAKNFSMDSNLLGSLNSKSGISDSSTITSECTGSAASVLSFSSDGVKDYNTVIQNIVSQPGALDKVIDEKGNGKTIKKKSFSDPSRRGELSTAGLEDSNEPSKELEQSILASTSEPILSEQRDELDELDEIEEEAKFLIQPEHTLPADLEENGLEGNSSLSFDPNLVNVLSPRVVRRSFKKRSNRIGSHDGNKEGEEPKEALGKMRQGSKHVRHASEPATFIPISPPGCKVVGHGGAQLTNLEPTRHHLKQYPVLISPLEDVSKQATANSNNFSPVDLPRTAPSTPTTTEPKPLKVSKPNVDMRKHVFLTLLDTEQSYVESLRTLMEFSTCSCVDTSGHRKFYLLYRALPLRAAQEVLPAIQCTASPGCTGSSTCYTVHCLSGLHRKFYLLYRALPLRAAQGVLPAVQSTASPGCTGSSTCCTEHCLSGLHRKFYLLYRALPLRAAQEVLPAVQSTASPGCTGSSTCCTEHCLSGLHRKFYLLYSALPLRAAQEVLPAVQSTASPGCTGSSTCCTVHCLSGLHRKFYLLYSALPLRAAQEVLPAVQCTASPGCTGSSTCCTVHCLSGLHTKFYLLYRALPLRAAQEVLPAVQCTASPGCTGSSTCLTEHCLSGLHRKFYLLYRALPLRAAQEVLPAVQCTASPGCTRSSTCCTEHCLSGLHRKFYLLYSALPLRAAQELLPAVQSTASPGCTGSSTCCTVHCLSGLHRKFYLLCSALPLRAAEEVLPAVQCTASPGCTGSSTCCTVHCLSGLHRLVLDHEGKEAE
ncbi:rho guanine nucleotide exchange factor 17-like [Rhinoderma darwinii]|uniref:rho guanine nucleotide exchange factor 17-like n=1 Tax=Rhinoderma darwinii TaxID=43563 RepID=UPI003F67B8BE